MDARSTPETACAPSDATVDDVLLSSLEVASSLYHLGQYCGEWSASTSGRARGSFHLVLHGDCWLHLPQEPRSIALAAGDGVFFLRDVPHFLSPHADPGADAGAGRRGMIALSPQRPDGTGLACGFFQFSTDIGTAISDALPDYLLLRADDARFGPARTLFQLILAESSGASPACGPLIERLTNLLLFYMLRGLVADDAQARGQLALARDPAMSALLRAVSANPGLPWTLNEMAGHVHMSPATFHRRFSLLSATTPAQWLQGLRMRTAARLLSRGWRIAEAAEHVGYQSPAAFSRLFQRIMGQPPSAWRRRAETAAD